MEEGVHDHHIEVPHTAPYLQGELRQLPTLAKVHLAYAADGLAALS